MTEPRDPELPAVQIPRGVSVMLRSILGIDPVEVSRQFNDAFKLLSGFCRHADARLVQIAKDLQALQANLEKLNNLLGVKPNDHDKRAGNGTLEALGDSAGDQQPPREP
jgi:hypothetical protein